MSKVTIVSTVTYAIEMDVPLGFLVDEDQFAREQTRSIKAAIRNSIPEETRLRSLGANTTVVAERPW
ncbi:hypothetical protein [Streptomyces collinus]|uniref:hypothetical protein n=1 Tax=Streptomyces collinus TaxID=42684 RepID=UPI0037888048